MVSTLVLIYFDRPGLRHIITKNLKTFPAVDPEICSIMIFNKRIWNFNSEKNIWNKKKKKLDKTRKV